MAAFAVDQLNYRFRDDSTALNTDGGYLALENINISRSLGTANQFRLRFTLDEVNNKVGTLATATLYSSIDGGGYAPNNSNIIAIGGVPTDGALCNVQLLGAAPSGPFESIGTYDEVDKILANITNTTKHSFWEVEFSIYLSSLLNNQTVDFRVYSGATPIGSYTRTPRVTAVVVAGAGPPIGGLTLVGVGK